MRYLGIDYGSKRVGIALSDDKGLMAFPKCVLNNDKELLDQIEKIITNEAVAEIVIGHSIGRDGEPNKINRAIDEFVGELTLQTGLPVNYEPEQYTTKEAVRFQGKTDMTDAAAASIILNSYITRNKND